MAEKSYWKAIRRVRVSLVTNNRVSKGYRAGMRRCFASYGLAFATFLTVVPSGRTSEGDFYLGFPLSNYTPDNAPISSVFDHSMNTQYSKNGTVIAYTGESGDQHSITGCDCYNKSDGLRFVVNGNYTGAVSCGSAYYLCYDGHPGVDYAVVNNTPVYSASDGVVYFPSTFPGVSNAQQYHTVEIDHQNGYRTYYLHLSSRVVSEGQNIIQGQVIGYSGDYGSPGAYHLHFEVQKNGVPVDPYGWEGIGADPYTRTANVNLWNPPLSIVNIAFAPFTANQGDLLIFYYMINNPTPYPVQNVRLGAQIRTSSPQGPWMDDPENDAVVTVTPGTGGTYCGGTTCWYFRNFKTQQAITTGQYDVRFVIVDNTTEQWFDSVESPYHLTVIPTGARKTADLNGDGYVNMVDAAIMMHYWGDTSKPPADINQDGYVNVQDVSIMMSNWYNP